MAELSTGNNAAAKQPVDLKDTDAGKSCDGVSESITFSQPNNTAAYMSIAQQSNDTDDDRKAPENNDGSALTKRREYLQEIDDAPMYDDQSADSLNTNRSRLPLEESFRGVIPLGVDDRASNTELDGSQPLNSSPPQLASPVFRLANRPNPPRRQRPNVAHLALQLRELPVSESDSDETVVPDNHPSATRRRVIKHALSSPRSPMLDITKGPAIIAGEAKGHVGRSLRYHRASNGTESPFNRSREQNQDEAPPSSILPNSVGPSRVRHRTRPPISNVFPRSNPNIRGMGSANASPTPLLSDYGQGPSIWGHQSVSNNSAPTTPLALHRRDRHGVRLEGGVQKPKTPPPHPPQIAFRGSAETVSKSSPTVPGASPQRTRSGHLHPSSRSCSLGESLQTLERQSPSPSPQTPPAGSPSTPESHGYPSSPLPSPSDSYRHVPALWKAAPAREIAIPPPTPSRGPHPPVTPAQLRELQEFYTSEPAVPTLSTRPVPVTFPPPFPQMAGDNSPALHCFPSAHPTLIPREYTISYHLLLFQANVLHNNFLSAYDRHKLSVHFSAAETHKTMDAVLTQTCGIWFELDRLVLDYRRRYESPNKQDEWHSVANDVRLDIPSFEPREQGWELIECVQNWYFVGRILDESWPGLLEKGPESASRGMRLAFKALSGVLDSVKVLLLKEEEGKMTEEVAGEQQPERVMAAKGLRKLSSAWKPQREKREEGEKEGSSRQARFGQQAETAAMLRTLRDMTSRAGEEYYRIFSNRRGRTIEDEKFPFLG